MSHNYPYRQAPADPRSDPRTYSPAGGADVYRRPPESFPSSSRSSAAPQGPQDGVLSLLSSCGLEPADLAALAKLPEDMLTVDSLPVLINQIKSKKGAVKPSVPTPLSAPPPSSSHSFSSSHRPSSSSSLDWDKLRRQPVQYPLHMIPSSAPLSDTRSDPWGSPSSVRSSSVRPVQDTDLRPRLSEYGKAASSCSSVDLKRSHPSRFSDPGSADYRSVPPADERRRRSGSAGGREPEGPVPSKQQGLDFHGSMPPVYPYSCSLCDITVLSEKVWHEHINGSIHADGQLKLLQQFPNWDCRVKHSSRDEDQSHRRRAGASSAPLAQRANRSQVAQPNRKLVTPTDRGRVVCVKFPAQSVDEAYLQSCVEPFGKMGKILMFPSVAFVELGTADQAKDLVKYYKNLDPAENKRQLDLSISNTFSFLQSSQVVSFTPAPSGRDGRSDLLAIVKRFGEPLYCLFLPSKAFVEMKLAADAKKLVDYYSTNVLKMNGDAIGVSFSTEYKTLMRVSLATRCDEEPTQTTTKEPGSERRTRSRSRDRSRSRATGRSRNRSRSRERTRGRSSHRSRSKDRSRRDGRTRTRTRSRENRDKSSKETKSTSEGASNNSSTGQNQTEERTEEPGGPDKPGEPGAETRSAAEPEGEAGPDAAEEQPGEEESKVEEPGEEQPKDEQPGEEEPKVEQPGEEQPKEEQPGEEEPKVEQPGEEEPRVEQPGEQQLDEEQKFPADDSDIEGMEVIAEDGEKFKDDNDKSQEESQEETGRPEESAASPEGDDDIEVKSMELDDDDDDSRLLIVEEHEAADMEDDEEVGFPVDLDNCITLDEVGCDDAEDEGGANETPEMFQETKTDETLETTETFQETLETFQETKTDETLETTETFHETKSDEIPENETETMSVRRTRSKRIPQTPPSDRKTRSRKIPEKASQRKTRSKMTPEETETVPETSPDTKTSVKETPETEASEETPETDSSRKTGEELRTTSEKGPTGRKTVKGKTTSKTGPETRTDKRKGTPEDDAVPPKTTRTDLQEEPNEPNDGEEKSHLERPEPLEDPPAPAEPEKPSRPVGPEFVRPVVGYFCNLCQLIFVDEDEAKLQHCGTPEHYRKYQEKTGKDPWSG